MALTAVQRHVCRLLADRRRQSGESYVAGGVALSLALRTSRLSRDVDIFHDTTESVFESWMADSAMLRTAGYATLVLRERPGFVQAEVSRDGSALVMEWAADSAFRFFPLVEHQDLGLTLHPFDLATNKVLALVGRLEVRDWVDVIECDSRLQPLGYLAWAASGKDPGFTPDGILEQAGRSSRYSIEEVASLSFDGPAPDASALSRRWHTALGSARVIVESLPREHVGTAVLAADGGLFQGSRDDLARARADGTLVFHEGRIGGAWPRLVP